MRAKKKAGGMPAFDVKIVALIYRTVTTVPIGTRV